MKKILEYAALVVVAVLISAFLVPHSIVYSGVTGYNSLSLTPSTATGDTYGLQVNGTTSIDMAGSYVGPVSSTNGTFQTVTTGLNQTNGFGLFVGGTSQNYNLVQIVFATSTFATTTFGPVTASTGTVFTSMTFPFPNLGTDDECLASLTSAPTSTAFSIDAHIAFASSLTATSTLILENGTSTAQTVGAGTITVLCIDPAF